MFTVELKSSKSNVRFNIVKNTVESMLSSRLFYLILTSIISLVFAVIGGYHTAVFIPIIFIAIYFKRLIFEVILIGDVLESSAGYFDWYSNVDDNLYLGALPLEHQDLERLSETLSIKAILSVVQSFELETSTLVGKPVTPTQWENIGIIQKRLDCADFYPPSFEALDAGAAFINEHLSERRRVYCHCKSGRGRSASMIVAYFIKYKGDDAITAFSKLKMKRSMIFDQNSIQMKNLVIYADRVRACPSY